MAKVRDLLTRKGPDVVSVTTAATVLDAARLMNEHHIGGVVVMESGRPVGIFTERDVLRRVVGAGLDPVSTPVRDVMSTTLLSVTPDTLVEECKALMTERRIRHVPVVGSGGLEGLVTAGDVMAWEAAEHRTQLEQLTDYVYYSR
jgi:CBS domain-containing protein